MSYLKRKQKIIRDFRKYQVWQDSQDTAVKIYQLTDHFDPAEKFGLTSQLRRAAVSISSNVAEGCSRSSERDFSRFIEIAIGSTFEVRSLLILCNRIGITDEKQTTPVLIELESISKKLNVLRSRLNRT